MRVAQGIFGDERVMIQEFGSEYPWEGIVRGLTKEAGDYYFYIIEDLSGKTHFVPRDAIMRISRIGKAKKKRPPLAPVIRLVR